MLNTRKKKHLIKEKIKAKKAINIFRCNTQWIVIVKKVTCQALNYDGESFHTGGPNSKKNKAKKKAKEDKKCN